LPPKKSKSQKLVTSAIRKQSKKAKRGTKEEKRKWAVGTGIRNARKEGAKVPVKRVSADAS
jgi:hypothetical protein|tara:strand:- start:9135 stop:9317 length:183 start_codon:yes stop_codon:yes gene_type:complete